MPEYPAPNLVPQVAGEGDIWASLAATGTIPERYLKRGMDNLGKAAFITKGTTRFLSLLTQRHPKSKQVNTREHRVHEIHELARKIPVLVTQTDDYSKIQVSSEHGTQIQPGDMLYNRDLYVEYDFVNQEMAYSTVFGEVGNLFFADNEPMLVVDIQHKAGAGGNDIVTVRRAARGKGRSDFGGAMVAVGNMPVSAKITEGMTLLRGLPSFPEGSDAPRGFHANPELDNNFTQEFKYALEITKESSIEKTYLGQTPIEIYKLLKMRQATLDMERTYFSGQKGKALDRNGRVQYMMGGTTEFILRDSNHFHNYQNITSANTLDYPGFLDLTNIIAAQGGGSQRDMYVGISLYTALKKSFYDERFLRYDKEASARFDIPIEVIVGAGIEFKVIPLYTMEEMGWGDRALILDTSVPTLTPVTHPDWDMKVEKDIQQKGQQIYKEQWLGIKGLERRYAQYQHIVDFSGVVDVAQIA
jgi:hypothetical protein